LAEASPQAGGLLEGVLITRDFQNHLLAPTDLERFTELNVSTVKQKQQIIYSQTLDLLRYHLECVWGEIAEIKAEDTDLIHYIVRGQY